MTDRIQKFLRKLSERERRAIELLVQRIMAGNLTGLDIAKLKGDAYNVYRVRKGAIRVIFQKGDDMRILAIERRSDTTYNEF